LRFAVLEERALLRIEQPPVVVEQRRHPERIALHAQRPGHVQEGFQLVLRLDRTDFEGHSRACPTSVLRDTPSDFSHATLWTSKTPSTCRRPRFPCALRSVRTSQSRCRPGRTKSSTTSCSRRTLPRQNSS